MRVQFDNDGYMEPGFHYYTIDDFEREFVTNFEGSDSRRRIFTEFKQFIKWLLDHGLKNFKIWIGGSFITNKINPKDIDVVVLAHIHDIKELLNKYRDCFSEIKEESARIKLKQFSLCDMYFVETIEEGQNSLDSVRYEFLQNYWKDFISHVKLEGSGDKKERGIVCLKFGD